MKNYLPILLLILVSCKKEIEKPLPVKDDFGIKVFNLQVRAKQLTAIKPVATNPSGATINVVLLCFNGYHMEPNAWSSTPLDLNPSGLNATEQQKILDSVQKDFKYQYNTITTDENLYNNCSAYSRVRVVITESWQWYGQTGGVSFLNSFTWGDNTPAFVFSGLLGYNLKIIQEAVSHEIGHTYGLRHQQDAGNSLKAPIMNGNGTAYYAASGEWWIGKDPYGNMQYDGRTMESINGGKYDGQMNFLKYGTY